MKITKKILVLLVVSLGSLAAYSAYPTSYPSSVNSSQNAISNTKTKALDAESEMTRRLRARIMADNQLSTEAHNIKIITMPKAITLKGQVSSRAEKVKIENYARSMAGDKKVYNQLTY